MVNCDINSSDNFSEEEFEIVSANANHCDGKNKIEGELTITNKRIVFSSNSSEDLSLSLNDIVSVKYKKNLFAISDKLTIISKMKEIVFRLNYSEDWVAIIEHLLKENSIGLK